MLFLAITILLREWYRQLGKYCICPAATLSTTTRMHGVVGSIDVEVKPLLSTPKGRDSKAGTDDLVRTRTIAVSLSPKVQG